MIYIIPVWDWKGGNYMDYKISDICNSLSIGKSTLYKRFKVLKESIPEQDWRNNQYFYYTENNKLFITEEGLRYIRNFNLNENNIHQSFNNKNITIYQNHLIEMYKNRIEYLESENKRLLDIIAVKEQRELARDVKTLGTRENNSFFSRIVDKLKHRE